MYSWHPFKDKLTVYVQVYFKAFYVFHLSMCLFLCFYAKIPWAKEPGGLQSMRSRLSNFTFTVHFHALEKEMATHSSVLAWRIPGTGEPGGLPSMGSHRVGRD